MKRPVTEVVKKPKNWEYKDPICPNCGAEIYSWKWGKMKCPHCGATITVKK